ncbi:MAG: rRNA (cytosine1402-N4)-methyltransferase [Acidimicrobiaceae bacterium]|jgi:16S rRNA (cytosine1402-N4)-methyltransferase
MGVSFEHRPVMVDQVVELLAPVPPGVVVDATVGGGGHASALLAKLPHITLLGLDRDGDAIAAAAERLAPFGDRVTLRQVRFDALAQTTKDLEHEAIAGALFDLGVSSPQVDRAERGFSYRNDGPLDMRMDRNQPRTAADVVNTYAERDLARALRENGDERFATRIAHAIVEARPVTSTGELAALVRDAIPAPARRRGGNPAKRTFQALRIEVNGELVALPSALDQAIERLQPGGRCVVLSYHSGEDRIVKERFRHAATGGCTCPPGLPCSCGATRTVKELRPLKRRPRPEEIAENRRAESAILRAVEKL